MPYETNVLETLADQIEEMVFDTASDAMSWERADEWFNELHLAIQEGVRQAARNKTPA